MGLWSHFLHGQGKDFHPGVCSDFVSVVKPCSCTVCCVPASLMGVGALPPDAVGGARAMASPLLSTCGEEGRDVGQPSPAVR